MSKKETPNNQKSSYNWDDIREYLEKELDGKMDAEKVIRHIHESEHVYDPMGEIHEKWDAPNAILDTLKVHSGGGFYHIFLKAEDERWIGIHPVTEAVSISKKGYSSVDGLYKAFWNNVKDVTTLSIGEKIN